MRVLFDPKIFELQIFGGISLYVTKLLDYFLQDKEVDFELPIVYSDNYYLKDLNVTELIKIKQEEFPFKRKLIKFLYSQNNSKILKALECQHFDIFHPTYFDNYFLKHIKKKPYILTVHDMTNEVVPEFFVFDKKASETINIKKHLIENASRVIAISENTRKDILKFCNIDEEKIDLIYHGQPFDKDYEIKKTEDLPQKYILFIGQRAKYKNFYSFLMAIADILKEDKELYLVVTGGSGFNKSEIEFIETLGVKDKVIKLPVQSHGQLLAYYNQATCFIFPSIYEGFGFPILEAFQCECPLVCSNTSSFPEVAGKGAIYFDPYDEISMKNSISKLIYDKKLQSELIHNGKEQLKKFNWKITANKTKDVYKKVLK